MKCEKWERKSCSNCLYKKDESCPYLKDLNVLPPGNFYCFEWTQIPYKAILKIPGMRLYDYHIEHPSLLKAIGIEMKDLMSHIPPECEGDTVDVIQNVEKFISLIYFPVFRKYVFINNSGLEYIK
jgi:hypothetical protein